MSFGQRYTTEKIPLAVSDYLLPQERQVMTVRYHPAILVWPALAVAAASAAGTTITVFTGIGGPALIAVWAVAASAGAVLAGCAWAWLGTYLAVTRQRVILVPRVMRHKMVSIPARQISDIHLNRTIPGRLLGYGALVLALAPEGQAAHVINYIPYPDQIYLEFDGILFGEDSE